MRFNRLSFGGSPIMTARYRRVLHASIEGYRHSPQHSGRCVETSLRQFGPQEHSGTLDEAALLNFRGEGSVYADLACACPTISLLTLTSVFICAAIASTAALTNANSR